VGDERRMDEPAEEQDRPAQEQTDEVGLMLEALRADIQQAKAELDATIAEARERAKRLENP
jgi:hypothetical protein